MKKKKKKVKSYRLNFYLRVLGMIEAYKPLPIHLVKYYIAQVEEHFRHTTTKVKIYIEDSAGHSKEDIVGIIASIPHNPRIRYVWGRRKVK